MTRRIFRIAALCAALAFSGRAYGQAGGAGVAGAGTAGGAMGTSSGTGTGATGTLGGIAA